MYCPCDGAGTASVAYESLECIALRLGACSGAGRIRCVALARAGHRGAHAGILEDYVSSEGVPYA